MFGCSLYIHNTKKACFVILSGCPYAPIHLDAPICLNAPCMLGCHPVFGHPHVWIPLYVRVPPVHTQHKKRVFCQTKGVFICCSYIWIPHVWMHPLYVWMSCMFALPHIFECPMFGHPSVWLDAPTCLDTPICLAAPLYVWMLPNVWWDPKLRGTSKHGRCPRHTGASKHGGIQIYGGHMNTPQSDRACFPCIVYVQQASKHLLNIHGSVHTYSGGIQI